MLKYDICFSIMMAEFLILNAYTRGRHAIYFIVCNFFFSFSKLFKKTTFCYVIANINEKVADEIHFP